jgi:hypothetical protein
VVTGLAVVGDVLQGAPNVLVVVRVPDVVLTPTEN